MDDILSSIRKIIEEDGARVAPTGETPATATPQRGRVGPLPATGPAMGAPVRPERSANPDDDVLLLTELVEEPGEDVARPPVRTPFEAPSPPEIKPPQAMPTVTLTPVSSAIPMMPAAEEPAGREAPVQRTAPAAIAVAVSGVAPVAAQTPEEAPAAAPEDPILSAMDRLARAVESAKPPITAVEPAPVPSGGRTLEEVVRDMLQPMLHDWIDKNLPQIVEEVVEREVRRRTRT